MMNIHSLPFEGLSLTACGPEVAMDGGASDPVASFIQNVQQMGYWRSEECLQKLDRSFVSRAVMQRWAALSALPTDSLPGSPVMQSCRKLFEYYLALMPHPDANSFHNSWARTCALFDVAVEKLVATESALLHDLPTVAAVIVGIARKYETSSASRCVGDLVRVASGFEAKLGLPRQTRTTSDLVMAEFAIFEALNWDLPQTDTYTCISAMLLRADILTKGEFKQQLELAWQLAVQECVCRVLCGQADGYMTGYKIVRQALQEAGFHGYALTGLLEEAAPFYTK